MDNVKNWQKGFKQKASGLIVTDETENFDKNFN